MSNKWDADTGGRDGPRATEVEMRGVGKLPGAGEDVATGKCRAGASVIALVVRPGPEPDTDTDDGLRCLSRFLVSFAPREEARWTAENSGSIAPDTPVRTREAAAGCNLERLAPELPATLEVSIALPLEPMDKRWRLLECFTSAS